MKRPTVATIAAALAALTIAAGPAATEGRFDGVTLTVGTFGGSWKDRISEYVTPKFEAEGGKIEFITGNPRNLLSKLIAARGQDAPMDVVEVAESTWADLREGDFLTTYNKDNIPNLAGLDPALYDDYRVGNWLTEVGIVYDLDKFKKAGIEQPTKFSDLMNPKLAGKVGLPDVVMAVAIPMVVGFAQEFGGDERNIDPGLEKINEIDVFSYYSSGPQATQLFESGDIWAIVLHAGWAVRLNDAGIKVGMAFPEVAGKLGVADTGYVGVVKGTKNQEAAEFYINLLISDEMQEILHTKNGIVPVSRSIEEKYMDQAAKDPSGEPMLMLSPKEIANLYYIDYDNFDMRAFTKEWNRKISNK